MNEPVNKAKTYKVLAVVFAVAGLVWIIGGIYSYHFFFYPIIGLLNWAVAWYCREMSRSG